MYLLILALDSLTYLLKKAKTEGWIKGMKFGAEVPSLTYMLFADDVIILAKAEKQKMYHIMEIVNTFSSASGQKVNIHKSGFIFGKNVNQFWRNQIYGM